MWGLVQSIDGQFVLSATDVVGFAECPHRTALDREVALGLRPKPDRVDPLGEILARAGMEHEARELAALRQAGATVVEIGPLGRGVRGLIDAELQTVDAMRSGASAIYQASFFSAPWRGHADFLLRVAKPSDLGGWSYEVEDAKLHRVASKRDSLQLAFYSDQVARLQGAAPEVAHVLLGDGTGTSLRIGEQLPELRRLQAGLLEAVAVASDASPEPNSSCERCRWLPDCRAFWRATGHLTLARVNRRTRPKLEQAGIKDVSALAALGPEAVVAGVSATTLRKARSDARLYLHEERSGLAHMRLRFPRADRGLSLLPEPAEGDVFFDLEGYPLAAEGNLVYLWGLVVRGGGEDTYHRWWAESALEEEAAYFAVVHFLEAAVTDDPDRRVYHYNQYEVTAMRRLGSRIGGDVEARALRVIDAAFVDLLPIARYSIRTSSMSAGLKALERFYRGERAGEVSDASGSIVEYDRWLHDSDRARLVAIESYNKDDCESLADLRDWLWSLAGDVAEARSSAGNAADPALAEIAAFPDLSERLVAASKLSTGGPLLRRTLVAMDFSDEFDADQLGLLLGWGPDQVRASLTLGKKELGLPLSARELQG
jgi:uncharacterized protein